jgi:SAM-dependent methyltransferase
VKCSRCGLVRSDPVISSEEMEKLYKESKFTYGEETENLIKTYIHALKPILNQLNTEDNILEVGCGNGFMLNKLYKMGFKNIYGVEPSVEAVKKADKNIRKRIIANVLKPSFFVGKKFKLIFFFQTLDHIKSPGKLLEDCFRLLAPRGYIVAFQHNIESWSARILGEKSPIIDIEHTHLYSPVTLKMIFEKYGFSTQKVYSPVNIISIKHLVWLSPFPGFIKNKLLALKIPAKISIPLKLGNVCIIAQKE